MSTTLRSLSCAALLSVALLPVLPAATSAQQMQCGPRNLVVEKLAADYKEVQVGTGVTVDGTIIELFASTEGTWTLLMSPPVPNAPACLVANGDGWSPGDQVRLDRFGASIPRDAAEPSIGMP